MVNIAGVFTSLVTPFSKDRIDYNKLEGNLLRVNVTGISGYLALGGNAETQSLSDEETAELLGFIRANSSGKILLAGLYCESTSLTLEKINRYRDLGADAIRLAPPHYFPYLVTDDLLERYYLEIADKSPLPIVLYNAPVLAGGVSISYASAKKLSAHPEILGIKDSSLTSLYRFINIRRCTSDFHILAGSASFFFPALMAGASGGDMTAANYLPDECCRLYDYVQRGELAEARDLHGRLLSVNTFISGNWGFCGVKAAMNLMGFEGGEPRAPYTLPPAEKISEIEAVLKKESFL